MAKSSFFGDIITTGANWLFGADSTIARGTSAFFETGALGDRLTQNLANSFLGRTEEGAVKRDPFPTQDMAQLSSTSRVSTPRFQSRKSEASNYGYTGKVLDKFYNSGALQSKNPAIRANVDYIARTIHPSGPKKIG